MTGELATHHLLHVKTPRMTVDELLASGAEQADQDVVVCGWVWDRFEHRAIYPSLPASGQPNERTGIWLNGNLPQRHSMRGDGPLHQQHIQATGRFHWQPRSGAGHFNRWIAWIGVQQIQVVPASDTPPETTSNTI